MIGHKYKTPEEDATAIAVMQTWRAEVKRTIDVTLFSPRLQQIIRDYEAKQEAWNIAHETDLEYLRRTMPDVTEGKRVGCMLVGAILGKCLRRDEQ